MKFIEKELFENKKIAVVDGQVKRHLHSRHQDFKGKSVYNYNWR
jgi:hypothetical protein